MSPGRRSLLHRRIGERLETAYEPRTSEIAAELAVHFERGREVSRAIRYLQQATETALQRYAYHEATFLLTRALNQTTGDWHRSAHAARSRVVRPLSPVARSVCAQSNDSGDSPD